MKAKLIRTGKEFTTRFAGLVYQKQGQFWRFIVDGANVGPCYHSKDEILADLNRYATEYGLPLA